MTWPTLNLAFHDSTPVFIAPRWLAPAMFWLEDRIGPQKAASLFTWLPRWNYKVLGICCFGKDACVILDGGKHCLMRKREWKCWSIYRALTELQAKHWHGLNIANGAFYRSPLLATKGANDE